MTTVTVSSRDGLQQEVRAGRHTLVGDEPAEAGGQDLGPDPYSLLLAALGTCTSITLRLYATRKGWPLERVEIELTHVSLDGADHIEQQVTLSGPLDDAQFARLSDIAGRCPVHRTLAAGVTMSDRVIRTRA